MILLRPTRRCSISPDGYTRAGGSPANHRLKKSFLLKLLPTTTRVPPSPFWPFGLPHFALVENSVQRASYSPPSTNMAGFCSINLCRISPLSSLSSLVTFCKTAMLPVEFPTCRTGKLTRFQAFPRHRNHRSYSFGSDLMILPIMAMLYQTLRACRKINTQRIAQRLVPDDDNGIITWDYGQSKAGHGGCPRSRNRHLHLKVSFVAAAPPPCHSASF